MVPSGEAGSAPHLPPGYTCDLARYVDRLAASLDVRRPLLADHVLHRQWDRHIVERDRRGVAAFVGPVEELQHAGARGGVGLILVDQDEGRAGDRPRPRAWLVEQQDVIARRLGPLRAG